MGVIAVLPYSAWAGNGSEISISAFTDDGGDWQKLDYSLTFDVTDRFSTQIDLTYLEDEEDYPNTAAMIHLMYDLGESLTIGVTAGASDEYGYPYHYLGIEAKYSTEKFELELAYSAEDGEDLTYWTQASVLYHLNNKSSIGLDIAVVTGYDDQRIWLTYNQDIGNGLVATGHFVVDEYGDQTFGVQLSKKFGAGKTMKHRDYFTNWWFGATGTEETTDNSPPNP